VSPRRKRRTPAAQREGAPSAGHRILLFLAVSALMFLFCLGVKDFVLPATELENPSYRFEWLLCSRFLEDGRIYDGTRPYCVHPPLLYLTVWAAIKAFGHVNLDLALSIFGALMNAASYLLLGGILRKENISAPRPLLLAMFLLLIAANTVGSVETAASTAMLLAGFYAMRYCPDDRWQALAGLLYFASVMFKVLTVPLIGIIVAYHAVFARRFDRGAAILAAALVIPLGACMLYYPHLLYYTVEVHSVIQRYALPALAWVLSPAYPFLTKQHLALYVMTAYLLYLLAKNRDVFTLLALSSAGFLVRHILTGGVRVISILYYYVPFNAFLIVALLKELAKAKTGSREYYLNIAVAALLLFYLSPAYLTPPLTPSPVDPLMAQIEGAIIYLPPGGGTILTGYTNRYYFEPMFSALGMDFGAYQFDYVMDVQAAHGTDKAIEERMRASGMIGNFTRDVWEKFTSEETLLYGDNARHNIPVRKRLQDGEYSIVMLAPPDYVGLYGLVKESLPAVYNCSVILPNTYYQTKGGVHMTTLLFKDQASCARMRRSVVDYYVLQYDSICAKSLFAAQVIRNVVLPLDHAKLDLDLSHCNSENDPFQDKSGIGGGPEFKEQDILRPEDIPKVAIVLALALAFSWAASQKAKAFKPGWERRL
jgi:hypothetical protein